MRLSNSCFIQKKSDCISDLVMKDIITVSMDHYTIENKCFPERSVLQLHNYLLCLYTRDFHNADLLVVASSTLQNSFLS
jgi:hypothetical protein